MRVALFGGSFNPIHNTHLKIAEDILIKNIADEVWLIPCGNHAFGKNLAKSLDRMNMINLAIENKPKIKLISVEMNLDRVSYTSQTVAWCKKEFPHDFYLVIGADNLKDLPKWHDFEYLKKNIEFILINRPTYSSKETNEIKIKSIIEGSPISSTQIRNKIANKESIKGLVPEKVEEYIIKNGVYHEK